jgi:hypothetical protein
MWRLRLISLLGVAFAHCGKAGEGMALTQQALLGAERMNLQVDQPLLNVHVGETFLLAGEAGRAAEYGKRALEIASAHENGRDEPWARYLLAYSIWILQPQNSGQAITELGAAIRAAAMSGAKPIEGHCRALLGEICEQTGEASKGAEYLSSAGAIYASLDMRPRRAASRIASSPST